MATTARARTARTVVPLNRLRHKRRRTLVALVPSGHTLVLLFAVLAAVVGLYVVALESSLFAIEKVQIKGATPALSHQINSVVKPFRGRSLVGLNEAGLERAILAIPEVRTARIDRDFPNTLRVFVAREHPIAVLRRGRDAWVIAASGKVVRPLRRGRGQGLPRIWTSSAMAVAVGEPVANLGVRTAIGVLGAFDDSKHALRPTSVVAQAGDLTLTLGSNIELRFGDASQAALKLAVSEKILPDVTPPPAGSIAYLDVSVPDRPVGGTEVKSNQGR